MLEKIGQELFARDTCRVARDLLGLNLLYQDCAGIIVETEAYRDDKASHAVTRPKQGMLLRQTYGHIYIYLIYGVYYCLNFTTEKQGVGAVLIRAVEPTLGIDQMKRRRKTENLLTLTNGPGKLFQAFAFAPTLHGEEVGKSIRLERPGDLPAFEIGTSTRIGISRATDLEWRFFIKGNNFVSKGSRIK